MSFGTPVEKPKIVGRKRMYSVEFGNGLGLVDMRNEEEFGPMPEWLTYGGKCLLRFGVTDNTFDVTEFENFDEAQLIAHKVNGAMCYMDYDVDESGKTWGGSGGGMRRIGPVGGWTI